MFIIVNVDCYQYTDTEWNYISHLDELQFCLFCLQEQMNWSISPARSRLQPTKDLLTNTSGCLCSIAMITAGSRVSNGLPAAWRSCLCSWSSTPCGTGCSRTRQTRGAGSRGRRSRGRRSSPVSCPMSSCSQLLSVSSSSSKKAGLRWVVGFL